MTRYKALFTLMMFLAMVGCATGTSGSHSGTSLQPKGKINCATIEPLTDEEWQFCSSGGNR